MNYKFFLLIPIFFSLTIANPLHCFTIKPQKFIDIIYAENQRLPKECGQHISSILKRYENDQGTVTVNHKVHESIRGNIFSIVKRYKKCDPKHKAALATYRMLNKLASQQENTQLDCPICTDVIGKQRTELACSHVFCTACLLVWFAQDKPEKKGNHKACPLCRISISKRMQESFKKEPTYAKILEDNLKKKDAQDIENLFEIMRESVRDLNPPQALLTMFGMLSYFINNDEDSDSEESADYLNSWTSHDIYSDYDSDSEGSIDYPSYNSSSSDEEWGNDSSN